MTIIKPWNGIWPRIAPSAFIADNATIIGDVEIGEEASVWYGAVLRADVGRIVIGARSNLQDLCCVHLTGGLSETWVGEEVTVGHGVILHGVRVGDGALVGMGSVLLDNARVEAEALLAAGSVLAPRSVAPAGWLTRGSPAKPVRALSPEERGQGRSGAAAYLELARQARAAP